MATSMFTVSADNALINRYAIPKITEVCEATFGKRLKNYGLVLRVNNSVQNEVHIEVKIMNGDDEKKSGVFQYTPYDEYFDEQDFLTHLNTSIVRFVKNL